MSDYETAHLVLGLQVEIHGLRRDVESQKREVSELRKDLRDMRDIANRWRGGLAVIVSTGAVIGWLLTQLDKIRSWLP